MAFDVKLETIRDFGKYWKMQKDTHEHLNLDGETPDALELHCAQTKENSDDPVQVKNLTCIPINKYEEVQELMELQESMRNRLDKKQKISPEFYH